MYNHFLVQCVLAEVVMLQSCCSSRGGSLQLMEQGGPEPIGSNTSIFWGCSQTKRSSTTVPPKMAGLEVSKSSPNRGFLWAERRSKITPQMAGLKNIQNSPPKHFGVLNIGQNYALKWQVWKKNIFERCLLGCRLLTTSMVLTDTSIVPNSLDRWLT